MVSLCATLTLYPLFQHNNIDKQIRFKFGIFGIEAT